MPLNETGTRGIGHFVEGFSAELDNPLAEIDELESALTGGEETMDKLVVNQLHVMSRRMGEIQQLLMTAGQGLHSWGTSSKRAAE